MSRVRHAIVSCAGLGSRLGLNSAKCLVNVNGKRIIDYILPLVADIEDLRIVVGFQEAEVMEYVSKKRADAVFVRNPTFASTSNSYSVNLGSHDLQEPFMIIDGDMIIEPPSFRRFLLAAERGESRSSKFVFDEIAKYLPLRSQKLECVEIDTPDDLRMAQREVHKYDFSVA